MGYRDRRDRDAKLVILETLRREPRETARDVALADALEAAPNFIVRTPAAIRQLCAQLEDVGGVVTRDVEGVFLATLADGGRRHLDELLSLDGVTRVPEMR